MSPYIFSLIAIFAIIIVAFVVAQQKKDNSIIDIFWSLNFLVSALLLFIINVESNIYHFLLIIIVMMWSLRLSIFILMRSIGKDEDFRYAEMRKGWGKKQKFNAFYRVFLLQGILAWIISLPISSVLFEASYSFSTQNYIGVIFFLTGFIIESLADYQKYRFKKKINTSGKIFREGLWKYSRHPNYFGEVLLWWGIFLVTFQGTNYWTIISPILITFLILKVSGIPMLEVKYGDDPEWLEYKNSTPAFFPSFWKK